MPHFESHTVQVLFYVVAAAAGVVLLFLGYKLGRGVAGMGANKLIATREQELFTAQKGFRQMYEKDIAELKAANEGLKQTIAGLEARVEEYRKKAAGYGGLFNSGGKRADAMYALLMENEALEEALLSQNEKLRQERHDAVKEQLRATGYRRVLMSQLMNDERIKGYVAEILGDERRLPPSNNAAPPPDRALPEH